MKKLFFILSFLLVTSARLWAQEDDDDQDGGNDKIRDKMSEFIQKRLDLSKTEADKFTPVFIRYFKEWRQTLREIKGLPDLDRRQKIVDLQLRFRPQFRDIIGEQRGNQVFDHQRKFLKEMIDLRQERMRNNPKPPLRRRVNKLL